jgi:hypothetical protein
VEIRKGYRTRILLAVAFLVAVMGVNRLIFASPGASNALAYTECPFRGPARVRVLAGVASEDTFPVRRHEEMHMAQCDSLGPWKYRWRNLTARGRLTLEAPGYCAGAEARLRQGMDTARVRERLHDDAIAAFTGLESLEVLAALRSVGPTVVP